MSSFSTIDNCWSTKNRFAKKVNSFISHLNKTFLGTTALHSMLAQHPDLHPSKKRLITYEELQFFSNDKIYLNGIDWSVERKE